VQNPKTVFLRNCKEEVGSEGGGWTDGSQNGNSLRPTKNDCRKKRPFAELGREPTDRKKKKEVQVPFERQPKRKGSGGRILKLTAEGGSAQRP